MRIDARSPIASANAAGTARRAGGARFSLDGSGEARGTASGTAATGVGGIEALLVLQGGEDPSQRRKRTVQRGRDILDALDGLKVALLAGRIAMIDLLRIRQVLGQRRETTDDPRLDDLLAHIELRAEVELAKLARAGAQR
jgi:hypothetical protein